MKKIGVVMLLSFAIVACNSAKKDTNKENKILLIVVLELLYLQRNIYHLMTLYQIITH